MKEGKVRKKEFNKAKCHHFSFMSGGIPLWETVSSIHQVGGGKFSFQTIFPMTVGPRYGILRPTRVKAVPLALSWHWRAAPTNATSLRSMEKHWAASRAAGLGGASVWHKEILNLGPECPAGSASGKSVGGCASPPCFFQWTLLRLHSIPGRAGISYQWLLTHVLMLKFAICMRRAI